MKQVILVRKDLQMQPGKVASQAAHAAMLFILKRLKKFHEVTNKVNSQYHAQFTPEQEEWMFGELDTIEGWEYGGIKKIVLAVEDLNEMTDLVIKARGHDLEAHFVTDETLQAITCCAIGPDEEARIDYITSHLSLYGREGNAIVVDIGQALETLKNSPELCKQMNELVAGPSYEEACLEIERLNAVIEEMSEKLAKHPYSIF